MSDIKKLPRVDLPPDVRLDTLAVREGLPPSQWGENSEALFLTSSFVHPDAATAAARFANEEEAFVYSRFSNPTVTMMERRLAAHRGHRGLHRHLQRHGGHPAAADGAAEGGRPRGVLAERVRFDHQVVAGRVRQVRRADDVRLADRRGAMAGRRAAEHQAAVRRDAEQPVDRGLRHRGAGGDRARCRRAAGGRQLLLFAGPAAAGQARRRYRDAFRHQVPGRPGPCDRGCVVRQRAARQREAGARDAQRRHEPVAVQCLGGAEGPGDAVDPRAGAERSGARDGAVARKPAARRARVPPEPALAPAACAGDGAAVGAGRRGGVVHRQGRPCRGVRGDRRDAHLLDHRQPR